ncbi:hypothetical protein Poli38472_008461 [Pythium oligandrum]|uniref:GOLD domain-containing protein n=1 Tax=Pythium oligandrum TaxID=41045 RepID=A0A8K1FEF5_PYTOL|nr:hypothetical protein Poli38472_008461 [Pythium oligandrum]|eukprot:TMW55813.1 hypothetical protein Poli38472_008461 [Pythium oligandrum]
MRGKMTATSARGGATMARLVLLMGVCVVSIVSALQVSVPGSSVECFSIEVAKYKHGISLNYESLRGVADELETELTDGKKQVIYTHRGSSGRFLSPVGEDGTHTVCFKSSIGEVVVGFSFHADDPAHEVLSNADATKIKQIQELEDLVYELTTTLDTVKDTQSYMKAIKLHHDTVIASTHSRIMWWSCVEALVLAGVAVAQLSYLRRTLEVRRLL